MCLCVRHKNGRCGEGALDVLVMISAYTKTYHVCDEAAPNTPKWVRPIWGCTPKFVKMFANFGAPCWHTRTDFQALGPRKNEFLGSVFPLRVGI